MKKSKRWILYTISSILLTLSLFASINFYMDPLWTFNHTHMFSDYQRASKERQQKSNILYFRDKKYDTLLFGSSRTTNMNQYTWSDTTFNYAVSDMQPNEYFHYLDFAINKAQQPIKKVIIGLDFFGALTYTPMIAKNPSIILEPILTPFYRYKLLLSMDSLDYSIRNVKYSFKKTSAKYNYNNVKTCRPKEKISSYEFSKNITYDLELYVRDRYSKEYDENYKSILLQLTKTYPNIEFIVFTTPVSQQHFKKISSNKLYKLYERWLKESVEIFDEVHHFMYISDLTKEAHTYFSDSNHGYNSTYDCLTNELLNKNSNCPKSSMILTNANIKEKLNLLRQLNTK